MTHNIPGLVVLLGSGETLPSSGKTHEYVAKRLPASRQVVVLETPAGFEPNSAFVAEKIKEYLLQRLQNYNLNVQILPARKKGTRFSPDDPDIVSPILQADEILLGPGSPTYAARQLRGSLALHMMQARHRLGATLFLSSSATLAFSNQTMPVYEIYKVGEDLHWQPGLDFLGAFGLPLVIIPHWNNNDGGDELDTSRCYLGRERFNRLRKLLEPGHTILGIDEHTSIILDFSAACCRVNGKGRVTLLLNESERKFRTGETFPLAELGEWQLPQGGEGIPAAVWQQALRAQNAKEAAEAETAVSKLAPPAEVEDLVAQRTAARDKQDWATADALRDRLADLGWQVQDTPEGPILDPLS